MIKENKIFKICALVVCALLYNSSVAFSDNVTSETQTVQGGTVTKNTSSGYATGGASGGGSSSGPDWSAAEAAEAAEAEEADKEAEDVNYSNLYNGRPLFPEAMMIHCKVNAEDIAEDLSKIAECIKQYVKSINNDNATVKSQALHEYDVMRYQALIDSLTAASDKLKSTNNFEDTENQYASAVNDSGTQRDTEAGLANSQAFSTNMINHLRDIYAEYLKLMAIEGIRNINPSAILTEEEYAESKTAVKASAQTESEAGSVSTETTITPDGSGNGTGTGSGTGADTGNNAGGQSGENNSNGENATASNSASLQTINNRVNELSNMNAEEIARHGYEIDNLRTEAANVMNDPNATPSEREAARRTISNINRLNEKVSDASRNNGSGGNSSTGGNNNSGGGNSSSNGVDNEAGARNNDNNNNSVTQPEQNNTNDTDAYDIMIEADRYNSLDTEDLIQHKSEIDSLLDQARRMENDPSIEPDDRAAAQKAREDLESLSLEIEEETKANQ